jgi:hypothetical protein
MDKVERTRYKIGPQTSLCKGEGPSLVSLCNDFAELTVEKQDDILRVSKRLLNIQRNTLKLKTTR